MPMTGWTEDDVLRFKLKQNQVGKTLAAEQDLAAVKAKKRTGKGAQQPNKTEAEFAKLYLAGQDTKF